MASETTTSFTGNQLIDAVLWGSGGASSQTLASKWSSTSLTFSFSGAWSASEQASVTNALNFIESVSGLTFTMGGSGTDLTFNRYTANDGYLGFGFPPDPYYGQVNTGDVYFNTYYSQYWNTADLQVGGVMFTTVVHEALHALGLGHPHDNAYTIPGVTGPADTGSYGLNTNIYTVMSYNDVGQSLDDGTQISPNSLASYGFQTLGAFDIAALQHLYGASSHNTGNDIYIVPTDNAVGTYYQTIWDTGGTDTIQYNGSRSVEIDLRAATLDIADGALAGGALSKAEGVFGGFTIANGVVIENATGGSGNDTLIGNSAANTISGGAGDDFIFGNGGDDVLDGGSGLDTLSFAGNASGVDANFSTNAATGADGNVTLSGFENLIGSGFADTLTGHAGANHIDGDAGNDTIDGGDGDDVLIGGLGTDTLSFASAGSAVSINSETGTATETSGTDSFSGFEVFVGSDYSDTFDGSLANETFRGGGGDDIFRLAGGADVVEGGAGTDQLSFEGFGTSVTVDLANGTYANSTAAFAPAGEFDFAGDSVAAKIESSAVTLANGNIVIAWEQWPGGILAQVIDPEGNPVGGQFAIQENNNQWWREPVLVATQDGGFAAVWYGSDASSSSLDSDVYVQRFDSTGAPTSDRVTVNTTTEGAQDYADIVEMANGNLFVVWESMLYDRTGDILYNVTNELNGQILDLNLEKVGSELDLDPGAGFPLADPSVEVLGNGDLLITGRKSLPGVGDGSEIVARRYDPGEDTLGDQFHVNETVAGSQIYAKVATLENGNYVVAWHTFVSGTSGAEVYGRIYDENGPVTGEFRLNDVSDGHQVIGDIIGLSDGGFLIAWLDLDDDVYRARSFDADGQARSGDVTISGAAANIGYNEITITELNNGNIFFSWTMIPAGEPVHGNYHELRGRVVDRAELGLEAQEVAVSGQVSGVEDILGGAGDDTLIGDANANVLDGGAGNDTLTGGAGDDIYIVDSYDDVIVETAGGGFDIVRTTLTDYVLPDHVEQIQIIGSPGPGQMIGNESDNLLEGGDGDDTLFGYGGNDTLFGGAGSDLFFSGAGADILNGGAGTDTVSHAGASAGVAVDLIYGGTGGDAAGDTYVDVEDVVGTDYFDSLTGTEGVNTLRGGGWTDWLNGRGGDDALYGEDGNDTLHGGEGADRLDGGAGIDMASYAMAGAGVAVDLAFGGTGGDAAGDTYVDMEGAYGTGFFDSISGDGGTNILRGGGATDWLNGRGGDDFLFGEDGNDTLHGGEGADVINGGAGTDMASYAMAGAGVAVDLAYGGTGGDAAGDTYVDMEGAYGTGFFDSISGDGGANILRGGGATDWLDGRGGDDFLYGEDGNDTLHGGAGADRLDGGAGTDMASYGFATSGVVADLAVGGTGGDAAGDTFTSIENLYGTGYADTLSGDGGANTIWSGGGDDRLEGRGGSDVLIGGGGDDLFVFSDGDGTDRINDFTAGAGSDDRLDLQAVTSITDMAELLAASTQSGADTVIDTGGGSEITLVGVDRASLHADDFLF